LPSIPPCKFCHQALTTEHAKIYMITHLGEIINNHCVICGFISFVFRNSSILLMGFMLVAIKSAWHYIKDWLKVKRVFLLFINENWSE